MILLSSFIVSFSIIYCPYYFIVKSTKKTQPYAYIKLSIKNIPMKKKDIKVNLIDKKDLKLKLKPKILNNEYQYLSDSKISPKLLKKKPSQINVQDKIIAREENTKKLTNIHFVNQKNIADDKDSVIHQSVVVRLADTINKSFLYNPKIKAQKKLFESSKENIKQVYSGIFPSIEMNLSKGYKDRDSSSSVQTTKESTSPQDFSINLEQTLYTGGKFTAEANKAKSQLLIEEENLRLIRYEVILESALSYLDVLEKKKLIELNNLKEEKFKNSFESIELLVKVGSASQSDLVFAQSKLVQIAAEKIVSINEFNITKANYKKIVGELLPNGNLEEPKINKINFPDNFDNALDIAFKNNPKIKIAELEENIAKFDVKSQFAELMPNITLDGEYQSREDTASKGSYSDTAEITAKITVPLFKGGKNFSKIKQAKIIAKKVRYELENKRNEVTETVTKSWTYFQTSETLLKAANINIEARKLMLEGIEHEVKLGIKSYIDLLQSKEDLIDAEFNKITAIKNYIISALQLKADIGELSLKDLYI